MPGWGFYARDQWQVTRKLTVNYGTRYEYYPFATRDHRGAERYDPDIDKVLIGGLGNVPTDTGVDVGIGQLAPRLGIAYRGDRKDRHPRRLRHQHRSELVPQHARRLSGDDLIAVLRRLDSF